MCVQVAEHRAGHVNLVVHVTMETVLAALARTDLVFIRHAKTHPAADDTTEADLARLGCAHSLDQK